MSLSPNFVVISPHPRTGLLRAVNWFGGQTSLLIYPSVIQMNVQVCFFENDGSGGYGQQILNDPMCLPYFKQLTASRDRLVNPVNGVEVFNENAGKTIDINLGITDSDGNPLSPDFQPLPASYIDRVGNSVATPMVQLDYFLNILVSQSVIVGELMKIVIQREDQIYHSFDKI